MFQSVGAWLQETACGLPGSVSSILSPEAQKAADPAHAALSHVVEPCPSGISSKSGDGTVPAPRKEAHPRSFNLSSQRGAQGADVDPATLAAASIDGFEPVDFEGELSSSRDIQGCGDGEQGIQGDGSLFREGTVVSVPYGSSKDGKAMELDDYEGVQSIQDGCQCTDTNRGYHVEVSAETFQEARPQIAADMAKVSAPALAVSRVFHEVKSMLTSVQQWSSAISHRPTLQIECTETPIWLLGCCYQERTSAAQTANKDGVQGASAAAKFLEDWHSTILITYRKEFEPLEGTQFTTDTGWGCMIRSAQMLLAEAVVRQRLGRAWRVSGCNQLFPEGPSLLSIVSMFHDSSASPFSLHRFFAATKKHGMEPGAWLGPYAACTGLRSLCKTLDSSPALGMAVHIVTADGGGQTGGVPVLCVEDVEEERKAWGSGGGETSAGDLKTEHHGDAVVSSGWEPSQEGDAVLLLVPLVLGVDTINPRYVPSLKAVFTFPQCVGMVGGKPGASTYLVGFQGDSALYLDPHFVQLVSPLREGRVVDVASYKPSAVNRVPLADLDPSLALGFFCNDSESFLDLCTRLEELARTSSGAPLLIVSPERIQHVERDCGVDTEQQENAEEEWELV